MSEREHAGLLFTPCLVTPTGDGPKRGPALASPRVITDAQGVQWRVSEGHRPDRIRFNDLEGEDRLRQQAARQPGRGNRPDAERPGNLHQLAPGESSERAIVGRHRGEL